MSELIGIYAEFQKCQGIMSLTKADAMLGKYSLSTTNLRAQKMVHRSHSPQARAPRWQSRAEILKKHLAVLSPEELRQVRPDYYWLRFGHDAWQREQARKYDPNQPRVPAGNPDGGQWTSEDGTSGQVILQRVFTAATKLAARKPTMSQCVDLCLPLLLRPQKAGRDYNEMDFRKCINACLGRLGR